MSKLDFSKPELLQTRDGRKVRIYCTDGGGEYPVHGAVFNESSKVWVTQTWTLDGRLNLNHCNLPGDLVTKPPRVTGWVNVYENDGKRFPRFGDTVTETQMKAASSSIKSFNCLGQIYIDAEIQN
jgi:hypothetical protein